ncbi:hypothetical protein GCM10028822_04900 [Hymenobacter terrigena]
MNWKDYEVEIATYFKEQFPNAEITHNASVDGRYSKTKRQIDILIEDYVAGNRIRIVIDGKFFSEKIDVKDVEMFIGMLNDSEANKGLLITQEGFSPAAINRAFSDPIDIELDILSFKDLKSFQGVGGIIYSGKVGAIVTAPFGWVLDGTRRDGMLASFYQRGLTFEEAGASKEFMYANLFIKDNDIKSLDELLAFQETYTMKDFPAAKISYIPTIRRNDSSVKIRVIDIPPYPSKEYTGFVEFEEAIFFCVMFTPLELSKKNIRKLESIMLRVLPLNVNQ